MIITLARKIATIIWHLITNDEMYEDETGYQKGEIQKRKIVETEIFLVDKQEKIMSEIFAIMGKDKLESTRGRYPHTFMPKNKFLSLNSNLRSSLEPTFTLQRLPS